MVIRWENLPVSDVASVLEAKLLYNSIMYLGLSVWNILEEICIFQLLFNVDGIQYNTYEICRSNWRYHCSILLTKHKETEGINLDWRPCTFLVKSFILFNNFLYIKIKNPSLILNLQNLLITHKFWNFKHPFFRLAVLCTWWCLCFPISSGKWL